MLKVGDNVHCIKTTGVYHCKDKTYKIVEIDIFPWAEYPYNWGIKELNGKDYQFYYISCDIVTQIFAIPYNGRELQKFFITDIELRRRKLKKLNSWWCVCRSSIDRFLKMV